MEYQGHTNLLTLGTGTGTSSGNSSPVVKPSDTKTANYTLPMIPNMNGSPSSSTPSTPNDDAQRPANTVNLPDEDYFMAAVRFRGDSKSAPGTPQGRRNVTFNLQLNNHDTWPSGEYDRRGEIATCNRLTPMLAQQIKEELNTFKMVCSDACAIRNSQLTHTIGNGSARLLQNLHSLFLIHQLL